MFTPRQDSETVIHEIVGDVCEGFLIEQEQDANEVGVFYIFTNNHRLRGFVDAWLLFLSEYEGKSLPEEALAERRFVPLEERYPIRGVKVTKAEFRDATLTIRFGECVEVVIQCTDDDRSLIEIQPLN
ncbi:hypothetical protein [Roseibium sp. MMSF_3412]|uniref:hypothetical protein n=1 Tax=Roseibium sp. MMSF_3412 TaxID=3046712 RepID=UPI00273DA227|nr:hypothetical protein [Roseibium sp. MMSF_3412]